MDERLRPKVDRRLAAILAADIAGYSVLMNADEARTVQDLKGHQAVVLPMIGQHGGRIIDTAGDGILAEFASIVNAVECAVAIQKVMAERNAGIHSDRHMQFRIGVNLGDVIHDEHRVYGDGVNIAARLESIADPGGIFVSGAAYEHVRKKVSVSFVDLGAQSVKNIAEPVQVYRIELQQAPAAALQARPALALPDKPSIAVLPFTNLSGDPKEDYFSDGITEDIITELSRFSELFVIARHSSFQFKGKSPDIRQVGRELGVRYVLEGSVRRAGERVRITGQLIDATTGTHRWAERYDRELRDVFAVQDEVARTIVAILAAHVNKAEAERTLLKPPMAWQAYDLYMRGAANLDVFRSTLRAHDLYSARGLFEQSLGMDPNYVRSYCALSLSYVLAAVNPVDQDYLGTSLIDRAQKLAHQAVQLDPNLPQAQSCLAHSLAWKGEHDAAVAAFDRAKHLNPNFTDFGSASVLVLAGEHVRATTEIATLMRLNPFYPALAPFWLALAYYMLEQYEKALPLFRESVARAPNLHHAHLWLVDTCMYLGKREEAQHAAREVLRTDPGFTLEKYIGFFARAWKRPEDAKHLDGLRMTGLP
jgi:TolB-like protein